MMYNSINNKTLGTEFEYLFLKMLGNRGFWAHRIEPDKRGSQPFDIIAIKDGEPYAFDCKTSKKKRFSLCRLQPNQITAFTMLERVGCDKIFLAVFYENKVYLVNYRELAKKGTVELNEDNIF